MLMFSCAALGRCSLMLVLFRTTLGMRSPVLMLSRTALGRSGPMLTFSRATLGGLSLMLVFSRTALGRCNLMLMSGFGSFFGQVRRDGLDPQGLGPRHHDWRCRRRKGTGGVVAGDHHYVIPCK
jgi:hypothetical protein